MDILDILLYTVVNHHQITNLGRILYFFQATNKQQWMTIFPIRNFKWSEHVLVATRWVCFFFTGILRCETVKPWQFFVTFLGWLSDPFQWLNDLQLGDEKVTLNRLDPLISFNVRDIKRLCTRMSMEVIVTSW